MDPAQVAPYPPFTPNQATQDRQLARIQEWWAGKPLPPGVILVPGREWNGNHLNALNVIHHEDVELSSVVPWLPLENETVMQDIKKALWVEGEESLDKRELLKVYAKKALTNKPHAFGRFWEYLTQYDGTLFCGAKGRNWRQGWIARLVRELIYGCEAHIVPSRNYSTALRQKIQFLYTDSQHPSLPMKFGGSVLLSYCNGRVYMPTSRKYGSQKTRAPIISIKARGSESHKLSEEAILSQDLAEMMSIFMNRTQLEMKDHRYNEAYILSIHGAVLYFRSACAPPTKVLKMLQAGKPPRNKECLHIRTSRGFDLRRSEDRVAAAQGVMGLWARYSAGIDDDYANQP